MKLPPYPKYKPSGVEWLGDVPEHWQVKRLMHLTAPTRPIMYGIVLPGPNVDDGVLIVKGGDVKPGRLTVEYLCRTTTEIEAGYARSRLAEGDIVFSIRGTVGEAELVPHEIAGANLTQDAARISCGKDLNRKYALYCMKAKAVVDSLLSLSLGAAVRGVNIRDLKRVAVLLPPVVEQKAIARFLKGETATIDTLVTKKRALIERLREKRTALISRTVTRGLPPNAARAVGLDPDPNLKPSGIQWLGDVPEHWQIVAVRRCAARIQAGVTPSTAVATYYEDGTVPWYGPGSFDDNIVLMSPVKLLHESAISEGTARLFARGATFVVTIGATLGKVSSLISEGSCNQQITAVEFGPRVLARFGTYALKRFEDILRSVAPSATLAILDQKRVADIQIAIPALDEQLSIVEFLDHQTTHIDRMIAKVETAIERLQEYRTALITAAVTGKIDVRVVDVPAAADN